MVFKTNEIETNDVRVTEDGVLVLPKGIAFPAAPTDGQLFFRSDEEMLYKYDGSKSAWVMIIDADNPMMIMTKRIIHVDKTGNDTTAIGGPMCPFLTIGKAVEVAKELTPSYNSPIGILVGPGEYTEQVVIDVSGINLYGYGQGITRIKYDGTALILRDNGVDTPPHDFKCVGISVRSTNAAEYSIDVQGVVGSTLGGSELQFRDGRAEGTLSIRTNLCNYIDYQNFYIMGKQLYQQTCGIWFEDSESNAEIKNDWDSAGSKPSDNNHYGLNFTRHWPKGNIVLLNDGIIGDDYRARKLGTSAGELAEGDHIHDASSIRNDSSRTGATVKDVLDGLSFVKGTIDLAGATPVDADVTTWADGSVGIGIGTGGKVFHLVKVGTAVKAVEMT